MVVVIVSAVDTRAADFGGGFPDELGEVSGFFGEACGGYVVVFDGFVTPGNYGSGGVGESVGEIFTVGAVLLFVSWFLLIWIWDYRDLRNVSTGIVEPSPWRRK